MTPGKKLLHREDVKRVVIGCFTIAIPLLIGGTLLLIAILKSNDDTGTPSGVFVGMFGLTLGLGALLLGCGVAIVMTRSMQAARIAKSAGIGLVAILLIGLLLDVFAAMMSKANTAMGIRVVVTLVIIGLIFGTLTFLREEA